MDRRVRLTENHALFAQGEMDAMAEMWSEVVDAILEHEDETGEVEMRPKQEIFAENTEDSGTMGYYASLVTSLEITNKRWNEIAERIRAMSPNEFDEFYRTILASW